MSDDRIRLPWETEPGESGEIAHRAAEVASSPPPPPVPESTEIAPGAGIEPDLAEEIRGDRQSAAEPDVWQADQARTESPAHGRPSSDESLESPTAAKHASPDFRRPDDGLVERVKSAINRTTSRESEAEWLDRERPVGTYDSWLLNLRSTPDVGAVPDLEMPSEGADLAPEFVGDEIEFEPEGGVLTGPRPEVGAPRVAGGRILAATVAAILVLILVGAYGFISPAVRGAKYQRDLRARYDETSELRGKIDALLGASDASDLAAVASESRHLADSYAPYVRFVNTPPPSEGVISFTGRLEEAIAARSQMLRLNELLGPATDQIRMRSGYYETLAAIRDQMSIVAGAISEPGMEGDDAVLVIEGSVANANSFQATLASQRPPPGFEALNSATGAFLLDFIQVGRNYLLAVKKADSSAAGLKTQIVERSRGFGAVLSTPVGAGLTTAEVNELREREARVDIALN